MCWDRFQRSADTQVPESSEWLDSWLMADAQSYGEDVGEDPGFGTAAHRLHAARAPWKAAESDDLLFVASSRSIRDPSWWLMPGRCPRVMANRGVNGIDGIVSTAMGAALAHQSEVAAKLCHAVDSLSLHDQNGLIIGPEEPRPDACLLVVD